MLTAAGTAARPAIPPGPYVVAGIGRAGSAAAAALAARGEDVRVWDGLGRAGELAAAAALAARGVESVHGGDGVALLEAAPPARVLVKSPGLGRDVPLVREASRRGLDVLDEAELGWRLDTRPFVAVTGTNGKSTTTALVAAVLRGTGHDPVCAGNTRFGVPLSAATHERGDVVVAELSSFQLEGCAQLRPQAALLTNVTVDHLYRHGTLAAYADCKRRLFLRDGVAVAAAAIGVDQAVGRELAAALRDAGATVTTFGQHPQADRRVLAVDPARDGSCVRIAEGAATRTLRIRLEGTHNALNVAGALALADVLGLDPDVAATAIAETPPLPGRFERIEGAGGIEAIVDYGHNPDGVARACDAARALAAARPGARLHVVLSALSMVGFEQARAVGRAAGARADRLVLTTQRWSLADPAGVLVPGLEEGAQERAPGRVAVEPDRAAAISRAIDAAAPGDVVLVLDRGELAGTLYDGRDQGRPFDDRAELRALLAAAGPAAGPAAGR